MLSSILQKIIYLQKNSVRRPYANAEAASTRIIKHRWVLDVIQIHGKDRLYLFFHIHTLTLCSDYSVPRIKSLLVAVRTKKEKSFMVARLIATSEIQQRGTEEAGRDS
jgi:predicted Zn-dependent protease